MLLHVPGQITWPDPDLDRKCDACAHFDPLDDYEVKRPDGKGRCQLVRLHQGVKGKLFNGKNAVACPKFEEKEE